MNLQILLERLARPAQRAILGTGVTTLEALAEMTRDEVAGLHGIGVNALEVIEAALQEHGLSFSERT